MVSNKTTVGNTVLLSGLLALVAAVYWPGLTGGFAFDDYPNLVLNVPLHVTSLRLQDWIAAALSSPATDLQRPLAMLSFAANHYFTGLDPVPMKMTNLAVHLLNTVLAFFLARALLAASDDRLGKTGRRWAALFVAACWALLPINLMPVLLIVQRMESLAQVFVFGGLLLYLAGRRRQLAGLPGWWAISAGLVGCTVLGGLCKESAALLPLYALCIEAALFGFRQADGARSRALLATYLVVLVLPAIAGVAWLLPQSLAPGPWLHRTFDLSQRLMTEPRVVVDYLRWTLFPDLGQLSLFHDDYPVSHGLLQPPATLLGIVGIALLLALAWRIRQRRPLAALGLAWFIAAQVMTATFLPLELVFEHRNYFASFGICLALADLLLSAPRSLGMRQTGMVLAVLALGFYGAATHLRVLEWSNPIRFAQTEARKHPQSPRATYPLAQMYATLSRGRRDSPFTPAAFEAFDRARMVPSASIAPSQGALLLAARTGTPIRAEWWTDIQERLRDRPIGPQELGALGALTDCALAGKCKFPPDEMVASFTAALGQGEDAELMSIYGNYVLNVMDDEALAERLWQEATRLRPTEPQYVISLAKLSISRGHRAEARAYIGRLRGMGRLGQYDSAADALDARLAAASAGADAPH